MTSVKSKVLVVEDSAAERMIIRTALAGQCEIIEATTLAEANQAIQTERFDLIVLDGNLPDGTGFEFCQKIRADERYADFPVIFLTSRSGVEDRVSGLMSGADDYVIKPFVPEEFKARVISKLRRMSGFQKSFVQGHFHVDTVTQKVSVMKDGGAKEPLSLTPIESKLMIHFLQNESKVFSREDLVKTIWGASTHISSHTVDTHISSLRKKIGESAKCIRAIQKQGYTYDSKAKAK